MTTNRIQQLQHTIHALRVRGLAERQEIRKLRTAAAERDRELAAVRRELAELRKEGSVNRNIEVICLDARQYESLSVARTYGGKA